MGIHLMRQAYHRQSLQVRQQTSLKINVHDNYIWFLQSYRYTYDFRTLDEWESCKTVKHKMFIKSKNNKSIIFRWTIIQCGFTYVAWKRRPTRKQLMAACWIINTSQVEIKLGMKTTLSTFFLYWIHICIWLRRTAAHIYYSK